MRPELNWTPVDSRTSKPRDVYYLSLKAVDFQIAAHDFLAILHAVKVGRLW